MDVLPAATAWRAYSICTSFPDGLWIMATTSAKGQMMLTWTRILGHGRMACTALSLWRQPLHSSQRLKNMCNDKWTCRPYIGCRAYPYTGRQITCVQRSTWAGSGCSTRSQHTDLDHSLLSLTTTRMTRQGLWETIQRMEHIREQQLLGVCSTLTSPTARSDGIRFTRRVSLPPSIPPMRPAHTHPTYSPAYHHCIP